MSRLFLSGLAIFSIILIRSVQASEEVKVNAHVVVLKLSPSEEAPVFPAVLSPYQEVLSSSSHLAIEVLAEQDLSLREDEEADVSLQEQYRLALRCRSAEQAQGLYDLESRVSGLYAGKTQQLIEAEAQVALQTPLVLRGLPLGEAEMALILVLQQPSDAPASGGGEDQEEDSQGDRSQQQEAAQDESDQETPTDPTEESDSENRQEDQPSAPPGEQEASPQEAAQEASGDPLQEGDRDMRNIEAILESLEEVDRLEQQQQRRVRERVRIRGDWW